MKNMSVPPQGVTLQTHHGRAELLLRRAKRQLCPTQFGARVRLRCQTTKVVAAGAVGVWLLCLAGCKSTDTTCCTPDSTNAPAVSTTNTISGRETNPSLRRSTYTPRVYPVDERGFSPVDKALAQAYAREDMVSNDAEGSLNPFVLKVISAYPTNGTYHYHCSWDPREYDIYNGVTEDLWYRGMVVAKAYPDGSRCSYCCGFTFEVFVRAMKLRNIQNGLDPDDFNGMTFNDLFNALQLWYIEGKGDSEQRAIVSYGLGEAVTNFDDARPGDFLSYSTTPSGGHSVIFMGWLRDDANETNKITGLRYFSSNLSSDGIGFGQAHFSDSTKNGHGVLRNYVIIGHVGAIKDYMPFNRLDIPQRNAYAPTQPERIIYLPPPAGTPAKHESLQK